MTAKPSIFLDDGGVMNDNRLRGEQWPSLVGAFFTPRLGGTPTAWAQANRTVVTSIFKPENWRARVLQATSTYPDFERIYWLDWLNGMCALVGITPPGEEESIKLAQQAEAYITPRIRAAFPGAIETIRALHAQGYTLHTASSGSSATLHGSLEGMGVRACFGRLYGSDLLNTLKETPVYYERLFADAQIVPADALIVDDTPRVLAWVRDLGAATVLINAEGAELDGMPCIRSLAELPKLLRRIV